MSYRIVPNVTSELLKSYPANPSAKRADENKHGSERTVVGLSINHEHQTAAYTQKDGYQDKGHLLYAHKETRNERKHGRSSLAEHQGRQRRKATGWPSRRTRVSGSPTFALQDRPVASAYLDKDIERYRDICECDVGQADVQSTDRCGPHQRPRVSCPAHLQVVMSTLSTSVHAQSPDRPEASRSQL